MIITKGISFSSIFKWTAHHLLWLFVTMGGVTLLYKYDVITFHSPWLPVSVIGTAVAFYVGFKNNQAYDRMWEARKIWGGIVNSSRSWGMKIDGFISNLFTDSSFSDKEIKDIKQRLIYRHIAWLYTHRQQLLKPTSWEHVSQEGPTSTLAAWNQQKFGIGVLNEENERTDIKNFINQHEIDRLTKASNQATQIINEQSRDIQSLREKGLIDDFRHMEIVKLLEEFYTLQGKNERIKKFPFPRQYASLSRYFVGIFIILFPFSMIPELITVGSWGIWLATPISVLIGWVYVMMEITGDYSENPFQGMANDIPMMSLCRTIEIDLREMLGETELPPSIQPKNGVLM